MSAAGFASTPKPPYYAVIFSSQRTEGDNGYGAAADRMAELAAQQPGFLGMESTRGADGFGITVAYFDTEENIRAWKRNMEHAAARQKGREVWYAHYEIRIARVERAYNFKAPQID
ncbi:antibiotic biosynthesis monooxygenase [Ferrovibrio terrae]|uniref:Antibiotic biosynthesis monooxygenase n=1 Tax=Ferrovibrio terrae TaxID=2594003 RepID=A0A516GZ49_9PROT|nr:antibiotic biosynthesis monooxygenase [Ferrovibrio terrae]QDO96796.1 antibiotic biosynthesis monooxygenase [Ferrovibrio terrae]